jgi:hypothetical protein
VPGRAAPRHEPPKKKKSSFLKDLFEFGQE